MALDPQALKALMEKRLYDAFKREFGAAASAGAGYSATADEFWKKMASAISDVAIDIVTDITTKAMVAPGIPTAGSPAAQVSVGPGKIT